MTSMFPLLSCLDLLWIPKQQASSGCLLMFSILFVLFRGARRDGTLQWFVQTPENSFKHTLRHRIPLDVFSSSILPVPVYPFSCAVVRLRRMMFQRRARMLDHFYMNPRPHGPS